MASVEQLEKRVSALEQIIIIIITGGGPVWPPKGDPFASDTTRLEALFRRPKGDPPVSDIARFSQAEVEAQLNETAAAITRLQALQGELNARLKELRAKPA